MASVCPSIATLHVAFGPIRWADRRKDSGKTREKRCVLAPPRHVTLSLPPGSKCARRLFVVLLQTMAAYRRSAPASIRSSVPRLHCQLRPGLWPLCLVSTISFAPVASLPLFMYALVTVSSLDFFRASPHWNGMTFDN
jgi:hypothetical protein